MYNWDASDPWTNCPNDCGQNEGDNTRTRNVVCKGDDDSIGIDSQCDGSKPDTEQKQLHKLYQKNNYIDFTKTTT